ncbi:hypothetical protein BAX95_05075 [Elizabethkingia meningoseptica]|uniref:hypothetical protein n=1 Tax=Elizabethkingia meningoseptica TaxID=238 RepID=UPI00099ADC92|nr:hypothetical protein [Elizabethkingia meningoseptica]OPC23257.1 hypothetical protein BAX95_05075 [Elizabethkingia meningoseptica]
MNTLEKKQIQKYLENKRLPLDLYLEIEDHIISQIEDMENNGIGFQEAFLQVQSKWKKELSFQNFNLTDIKAVPKIVERIRKAFIRETFPKVLFLSLLVSLIMVVGAYQLDKENFTTFYTSVYIGVQSISALAFIINSKTILLKNKYKKQQLNAYQKMVDSCVGLCMFPFMMTMNAPKCSENFFNTLHQETNWKILLELLFIIYFSSISLFSAFVFIKYKKEVAKMRLA